MRLQAQPQAPHKTRACQGCNNYTSRAAVRCRALASSRSDGEKGTPYVRTAAMCCGHASKWAMQICSVSVYIASLCMAEQSAHISWLVKLHAERSVVLRAITMVFRNRYGRVAVFLVRAQDMPDSQCGNKSWHFAWRMFSMTLTIICPAGDLASPFMARRFSAKAVVQVQKSSNTSAARSAATCTQNAHYAPTHVQVYPHTF